MAWNLDSTPFPLQYSMAIEHESTAFYATHLLAVHVFHLDDAEQLADGFIGIAQQFKRKIHLDLEVLMRLDAVARNADNVAAKLDEIGISIAELLTFGGTAGRVVLGIKINYQTLARDCGG